MWPSSSLISRQQASSMSARSAPASRRRAPFLLMASGWSSSICPTRESSCSNRSAPTRRCAVFSNAIPKSHPYCPLVAELESWMRAERARLSRHADAAKAMDYMLKRWPAFTRFLDDGRICLTNNAAERALRGIALGRRAWLFAGSDRGGERAAAMFTLIETAKLNNVDPQTWLADVLCRINDHPAAKLNQLLPWHWKKSQANAAAA